MKLTRSVPRVVSLALLSTMLAIFLVFPVSAHEDEGENDVLPFTQYTPVEQTLYTCENQLAMFQDLFVKHNLWDVVGIPVISPGDSQHKLLHMGELPGQIVELDAPYRDYFVAGSGCHPDLATWHCRCTHMEYPHGPDAPRCIQHECVLVSIHYQHTWNCD